LKHTDNKLDHVSDLMADLVADAHAKDKIPLALVSLHGQGGPILATSQLNRSMIDGEQEQCSQPRMGGCGLWRMEDSDELVKVLWEVQWPKLLVWGD
jgi:hypothetical protein